MTNAEFTRKQDTILHLNGAELATLLGTTPASVSRWRKEFPIPETVANLLDFHVAEKLRTITFPISLTELFALSRLAEARHLTVETFLVELIRSAIAPALTLLPDAPATKVADDPTEYNPGPGI